MDIKIESIDDVKKLVAGEHESQQKVQVGYDGEKIEENQSRKVGDRWFDEDGYEWEQRKGYKIKLGKEWQQQLDEYLKSFVNCPKETCTCTIPKRLDKKMRRIHGMCLDCVIDMEHNLRIQGKWEEYEKKKIMENALSWLEDAKKEKDYIVNELSKLEFTNDFGDVEKWKTQSNKEELLEKIEKEFEEFSKNFIEKIEKDLEDMREKK